MNSDERNIYIDRECDKKRINNETKKYIKQYISLNEELFSDFLDIDEVTQKLLKNIRYSIKGYDAFKDYSTRRKMKTVNGAWIGERHSIYLNPKRKKESISSENKKKRLISTIMHEMDHCTTTKYVHINKEEANKYIIRIKKQIIEEEKNPIKRRKEIKKLTNAYSEINGRLPISGINDLRQTIDTGIGLRSLDEGIIAWKQEMYDKCLGINPNTGYINEKKVAKFIAETIGKENLIRMHFNNNYTGIREEFFQKTGEDLNNLVQKLNERPNNPKFISIIGRLPKGNIKKFFIKSYVEKMNAFSKDINESITNIKEKNNKNAEFIPRCDIDEIKSKHDKEEKPLKNRTEQMDIEER